jgi:hypothetical protein
MEDKYLLKMKKLESIQIDDEPITLQSKKEKKSKFKYYYYRYRCQMLKMPVISVGAKETIVDAYLSSLMHDVIKGLRVSLWQNFGTVEIKEFPIRPWFKDGKLKGFIDWKKTMEENIPQENGKRMLMYSDHTVCYKVSYCSGLFNLRVAKKDHGNGLKAMKAKELNTNKDIIFKYRNKKKAI